MDVLKRFDDFCTEAASWRLRCSCRNMGLLLDMEQRMLDACRECQLPFWLADGPSLWLSWAMRHASWLCPSRSIDEMGKPMAAVSSPTQGIQTSAVSHGSASSSRINSLRVHLAVGRTSCKSPMRPATNGMGGVCQGSMDALTFHEQHDRLPIHKLLQSLLQGR